MKNKLKRFISCVFAVLLISAAFGSGFAVFGEENAEFLYELSDDGTAEITKYTGGGFEVNVPETIDGYPVTGIGEYAFLQLTDVTKITIPKSVTKIGEYAFDECYSLKEIDVDENNPYYSSDDKGVLFNKDRTELIQYPAGSDEKEYIIPGTAVKINSHAFTDCKNLEAVTISESVSDIDEYVFYETGSLSFINVSENNSKYSSDENGVLFNKDKSELLQYPPGKNSEEYTVPESVKTIGTNAFRNCNNLIYVKIPESVSVVKSFAFAESGGLKEITIPDGVKTIGNSAFNWCRSLESVQIGSGIENIGEYAFFSCGKLKTININGSVKNIGALAFDQTAFYADKNNWEDDVLYIGGFLIYAGQDMPSQYTVREGTRGIADSSIYGVSKLTSLTIPKSVQYIELGAIQECVNLAEINVDKDNEVYSSDEHGVLFNKDKTKLIKYPVGNKSQEYVIPETVTSVDMFAFGGCTNLISVKIPQSVTDIGNFAFSDCGGLKEIVFPHSVTSIGNGAFVWCDSLESVVLPSSLTGIESDTFVSCKSLKTVIIPDTVTSIGTDAFASCESLESVTIPESVISIAKGAFDQCNKLENVYYTGSREQWNSIEIGDSNENLFNNIVYDYSQNSGLTEIIIIVCLIIAAAAVIIALTVKKRKHKKAESER